MPETVEALARHRRRAVEWAVAGLIGSTAGGWLLASADEGWGEDLAAFLFVAAVGLAFIGLGAVAQARRMRRVLAAGPWSAHPAALLPHGMKAGAVVLSAPEAGEAWPLTMSATWQRFRLVQPGSGSVLWWCGDPRTGGVLAQPGGGELFWAKPVRGRATRAQMVRQAVADGLLRRPAPAPPQGPAVPAAGRVRAVRLLGLWRWVVVIGALATGVGHGYDQAAQSDPLIEVVLRSKHGDRDCTVEWRDPFDGSRRTGPFRCAADADPAVYRWDNAFVVSYGPWKGELYNLEREGTDAFEDVAVLSVLGAGVLVVGLVGGTAGFLLRRRSSEPVRVEETFPSETRTGPGPDVTYGALAAAVAGARPRRTARSRLREADVRTSPWWRVRGLRRISELEGAAVTTLSTVALVVGWRFDEIPGPVVLLGVVPAAASALSWYRLLTHGRHVAVRLARAATAPVPVPKRYVLVDRPEEPLLVVFGAHGGDEDRPEGVLPLLARSGPAEPTGEVDLRGWLDRDLDGRPLVVAWAEGRALWPAEPYLEAGTAEFASRMESVALLAAPASRVQALTPPPSAPRNPG
ncbi:hypothetical protein ABZ135_24925 [Streptomyces sp. NPDC006339]|uniref:hypothetical protein n=1 Tax=Streptomyces sp. NPDC006339 TaxID=3156755 RepID=UPI0033A60784